MNKEWYYTLDHQPLGPVTQETIEEMLKVGVLQPSHKVWHPTLAKWTTINRVSALRAFPPEVNVTSGERWYFLKEGKRLGPVSLLTLQELVRSGILDRESRAWSQRLAEWTPIVQIPFLWEEHSSEATTSTKGMQRCPHCAETLKQEAVVCRYCGRHLSTKPHKERVQQISNNVAINIILLMILMVGGAMATLHFTDNPPSDRAVENTSRFLDEMYPFFLLFGGMGIVRILFERFAISETILARTTQAQRIRSLTVAVIVVTVLACGAVALFN